MTWWRIFLQTGLRILSGLIGVVAAVLWFMSAAGKLPLAPGAAIGGTLPTDPFNVALRHSARLNQWAAGTTGVSVLLMVAAEFMGLRIRRDDKDRMTIPRPGQTVHLMSWHDVLRVRCDMHRKEGRNVRELVLYTTDDLRRSYQATNDDPIRLRDGIVSRVQLVAEIRWRIFWARFGYGLLLVVSVIAAVAAVIAAVEGWK